MEVEEQNVQVFTGSSFWELRRDAAFKLFENFFPASTSNSGDQPPRYPDLRLGPFPQRAFLVGGGSGLRGTEGPACRACMILATANGQAVGGSHKLRRGGSPKAFYLPEFDSKRRLRRFLAQNSLKNTGGRFAGGTCNELPSQNPNFFKVPHIMHLRCRDSLECLATRCSAVF